MADEEQGAVEKKQSPLILVAIIAVLTLVAGGGGWFLGVMLAPPQPVEEKAAAKPEADGHSGKAKEGGADEVPRISTEENGIVLLDPITSNLAYPSENRVRLEVALMFNGPPDVALAEEIHQDILAYMRTVTLQQVQGARGFQYLREDLKERVDLRSEGRVTNVMFRTFVIE